MNKPIGKLKYAFAAGVVSLPLAACHAVPKFRQAIKPNYRDGDVPMVEPTVGGDASPGFKSSIFRRQDDRVREPIAPNVSL